MKNTNNYDVNSIQILSDLQHIYKRRHMYIGEHTKDPRMLYSEILDNAVDEMQAGYGDKIVVNVDTKSNIYDIRDYGRGIPHGMKTLDNGEQKEVIEVLTTMSNTGGKFNHNAYKKSCFTGDTKIKLADGSDIAIEDLYKEFKSGLNNYTFSIKNSYDINNTDMPDSLYNALHHEVVIELIRDVRIARTVNKLAVVTLSNGKSIKCTPDHRFIKSSYEYTEAKDLKPGDKLKSGFIDDNESLKNDKYSLNTIYREAYKIAKTSTTSLISSSLLVNPAYLIIKNSASKYNLSVISVELIDVPDTEVYDISIREGASNFLLSAGVFVKNCGLHGVGSTVTNALSSYAMWESFRDGKSVRIEFHNNGNEKILRYGNTKEKTGTHVQFIPDSGVFSSPIIPKEYMVQKCSVLNALGCPIELNINNELVPISATIWDLIPKEDNISIYKQFDEIKVKSDNDDELYVAMQYTSDTADKYYGYANMTVNSDGGSHIQVTSRAIINTWKKLLDTHNRKYKTSVQLHDSDFLLGLRCVVAAFIEDVEFSSQTKEKLVTDKKYFNDLIYKFSEKLYETLECNSELTMAMLKRFEEYRISQNKLLSRKEITSLIKINEDSSDNIRRRSVVSKLIECTSKKREGTEMFIVEGDSAAGPFKDVRNKLTQAILPLRGKIKNVTYLDVKDAIKNNEICDIANSIGCGIGSNCDASKSRYDRIIISADADPDGEQITCLVLSAFVNMFPDMIRQGRVFIAEAPLYCWGDNPKNYGWTNDISKIPDNVKYHRFKGLGEMNTPELEHFLVNPDTRNIYQIEFPSDIDKFNKILGSSSGRSDLMKELGIMITG